MPSAPAARAAACPPASTPSCARAASASRCRSSCAAAPWRFGGALATAIRRLKFTRASHVARTVAPLWAPIIAAATAAIASAGDPAIIVPVPMHWRRRAARGYDHAWLLALHACAHAGIRPPVAALNRLRAAPAQSTLTAAAPARNQRGAFAVRASIVNGRAVVLVDDVATTCATLAAATRPLLAAGATRVLAVTLART